MINLYYGSLRNATITEGDVTESVQYPLTNINYLSKHLTSSIDANDSSVSATNIYLTLANIDFGTATAVSGCAFDVENLEIDLVNTFNLIDYYYIKLQRSSDAVTYTDVATLYTKSVSATSINETLSEIYTENFTEVEYRYYRIVVHVYTDVGTVDSLDWDISGTINNLYLGGFLELPCPNLQPEEWEHNVNLSTSIAGYRNAVRNQAQRDIFTNNYVNINPTYKANVKSFDSIAGKGAIPVYYEDTVDDVIMFARVTNQIKTNEQNTDLFSFSQTIEEEL